MSRLAFRAELDTPRPPSAWLMMATASLSLAATGQLVPFAWLLAGAGLGLAAVRRRSPLPAQRSGAALNLVLSAVAAGSVALWVRGELVLVALAHFTLLAGVLQLLDARPRRSEFLLVAIALFEVVLAANLTDALWFTPLLVVFALAAVWTLTVHTLRSEALEAGDAAAAQRALSAGLQRTTLLASLLTVGLALAIFPLLPRLRSGVLAAGGLGLPRAIAGFSHGVDLGASGPIRPDAEVMLRVETVAGEAPPAEEAYWRGLAFDRFDGRRWSATREPRRRLAGDAELGVDLRGRGEGRRLVQRIVREPVEGGVLFSAGDPLHLEGALGRIESDAGRALYAYATARQRVEYELESRLRDRDEAALARDVARPPAEEAERWLTLPPLSPAVHELAARIAEGAASDAARALALERHLRRTGRYTDTPPDADPDRSPLEAFLLGDLEGHCEYFASAMAVLARSLGLPARLVNGFAGGRTNPIGGFVEVTQSDAHAWVEIHYASAGWVRYDPTPPDERLAGADALSASDRLAALASTIELWWFRNVVDFDRTRQLRAVGSAWRAWQRWRSPDAQDSATSFARERPAAALPDGRILAAAAFLLAGAAALWARRSGRRAAPLPAGYREALRLLARRGLVREPATAARDFARRAARALPPEAGVAFARLTEAYLAERFGGRADAEGLRALHALRDSLGA